jgi:hypothetical protein
MSCIIGSNQCDSKRNLTCNTNTSVCQCDSTQYWNTNLETCCKIKSLFNLKKKKIIFSITC